MAKTPHIQCRGLGFYPCLGNYTSHATTSSLCAVAAAAKSLQSCPTLCDPIDGWDSPGKNTGVGCHFLLRSMKVKSESEVTQSCPTLRDPMDCSPPGSSTHGNSLCAATKKKYLSLSLSLSLSILHTAVKIEDPYLPQPRPGAAKEVFVFFFPKIDRGRETIQNTQMRNH